MVAPCSAATATVDVRTMSEIRLRTTERFCSMRNVTPRNSMISPSLEHRLCTGVGHHFRQQRRLDIAATHDGDYVAPLRQFLFVEEISGKGDGTARFDDEAHLAHHAAHRFANFVLFDGDDVIDILPDDFITVEEDEIR